LGERICKTPEEFKAWSQNLGHEQVLTTFFSYGEVAEQRQSEIIQNLSFDDRQAAHDVQELAKAIAQELVISSINDGK
jgi:integrase/recombinase XerD